GDADDQKGKPNSKPQPSQVVTPPPTRPDTVISQADLNAVFADADSPEMKVTVDASGMIELNGMAFKGGKDRRLLLEGAQDAESNVLRFDYANNARLVGVTVEGGEEVVFRKIKFQLDTATPLTPNQAVAPVAVRGAKRVRFEQCIFLQNKVQKISTPPASDAKRVPLASLLIDVGDKPAYPQTIVDIDECYFDSNRENGGQVAIAINGPAKVTVTNTAFRPHSAFFSFRDKCTLANTDLLMKNCTCFVVGGPAFRLSDRASARVRAQNSVFSRPGGESLALSRVPGLAEPGLIYLSDAKQIRYSGEQNLYHLLNDLVELKKGGFKDSKKDFLDFLGPTSSDVNSTYISVAESANNPLTFANPLKEDSVLAFQLREEYAQPNLGLQRTWLGQAMPRAISAAPPLVKNPAPKKNIVDPDDARRKADEFANIAEALSRAKSGDVIEIKHVKDNREVEIPPIALKPGLNVTLKAHEGYQPVLVLDKAYKDKDSALFKLLEGKLQFEQLGFVLDPQALGFESQSVVHLGEAAHCAFKQCVVTLKAQSDVQLNVATLVDLNLMMKMDTAPPPARLEFHDCFIRGRGDLVSLRGSRVLNVEMKNSLVVLDGSLLDVTASDKAAMRPQDGVRWKMERTSAFTTDSIFALRSRTANGLARTDADVKGCLLVSLRPERPIVLLDMKTGDLERYLKWEGDQNSYANFDKDNVDAWKNLFGGANADFGKITLPRLTEKNMQSLWDAEPDWLRPTDQTELDRIQNVGIPADIEMKLLQPLDTEEP
ncbi:MAG TPA: hypothetical protein VFE62_06365, partial [Gemmataceae bacterium]|nr:hypothetical protein [Gemmataceae bacterium]